MGQSEEIRERIEQIVNSYDNDRRHALAVMQDMQHEFNYIPKEGLEVLSKHLECPVSQLYSMASFYKALSLKPKGKHVIKVCDGTACHIRGATTLVDGIERELGIKAGETTEDGLFSLETVNCVGACALAPVMVIDGVYYGKVTQEKIGEILKEVSEGGEQ